MFGKLRRRIKTLEHDLETLAGIVGTDCLALRDGKTYLSNPRLNALGRIDENRKSLEQILDRFSENLLHVNKRVTMLLDFLGLEETKPTPGGEIVEVEIAEPLKAESVKRNYKKKGV